MYFSEKKIIFKSKFQVERDIKSPIGVIYFVFLSFLEKGIDFMKNSRRE